MPRSPEERTARPPRPVPSAPIPAAGDGDRQPAARLPPPGPRKSEPRLRPTRTAHAPGRLPAHPAKMAALPLFLLFPHPLRQGGGGRCVTEINPVYSRQVPVSNSYSTGSGRDGMGRGGGRFTGAACGNGKGKGRAGFPQSGSPCFAVSCRSCTFPCRRACPATTQTLQHR